jgi:hypothetical protein
MSATDDRTGARHTRERQPLHTALAVLALLLLATLALSQAIQAWAAWQRDGARHAWAGEAPGTPISVLLVNGQIYYGELVDQSASHLRLTNVYYVQTVSSQSAAQPNNQLVNRSKTDWHGPLWMTIPADKILLVEGIGPNSRLAELIAQEKKLGPGQ